MTGLAARFFGSAVVYAVVGMALGLAMGMTHDHSQMPTHAHILVIGWVSFAIYGLFYHLFPAAAAGTLAAAHFWLAQAGLVTLITGLFLMFAGTSSAEPLAAIGSIGLLVSAVLFAFVALPVLRARA
jgi:cbb3-type cytochrome oxidase subunit 1